MEKAIFVILTHTNTSMGGLSRLFSKGYYNHASIAFTDSLSKMYSFSRYYVNTPLAGGFVVERPERYLSSEEPTPMKLYMLPADNGDYNAIRRKLRTFIDTKDKKIYNTYGDWASSFGKKKKIKDAYTSVEFISELLDIKDVNTVGELEKVLEHYRIYTGTMEKYLHGEYECDTEYYERQSLGKVIYGTASHYAKLTKRALFDKR